MSEAITPERAPYFSESQIAIIKAQIAKGATHDELTLFLRTCERLRLDPFARQIFLVKRRQRDERSGEWVEVATTQVSIDGLRVVAERSGDYEGQTAPQWCGDDGKWRDVWLDRTTPPAAARVGVHRKGFREPLVAIVRWDSFAQTKRDGGFTAMWSRMGDLMLAKCAESQALRKAFPMDLSGVYTIEEFPADAIDVEAEVIADTHRQDGPTAEGKRLRECSSAELLRAWVTRYRGFVGEGKRYSVDAVRAHALTIGAEAEVDGWLGITQPLVEKRQSDEDGAGMEDRDPREQHDAESSAGGGVPGDR